MLTKIFFICFFLNALLQASAENGFADVFRPRALSLDTFSQQLNDYWTKERLENAKLLDIKLPNLSSKTIAIDSNITTGPPSSIPGSLPTSNMTSSKAISSTGRQVYTTGRVFWKSGTSSYSCSASVIQSNSGDLISTAGHCVYDTDRKTWYNNNNWVFIPAYSNGNKPYGTWPGRRFTAQNAWLSSADFNYDVGLVALQTLNGKHIQSVVGAQGISFNQPRGAYTYSFGYPSNINNGETLQSCASYTQKTQYNPNTYFGQGLPCIMGQGCSGGPWLQNFVTSTGLGYVTSVNSFTVVGISNVMNGPYFDSNIKTLYNSATSM